jgi:hypothetical protein
MASKLIYGLSILQVYLIGLVLIQYDAIRLTFVECIVGLECSFNFDVCLSVLPLGLH